MNRGGIAAAVVLAALTTVSADQEPDPAAALASLAAYLEAYEGALGTLVADERLTQWPIQTYGVRRDGRTFAEYRRHPTRGHELLSEVAFVPLPADAGWLGYRDVQAVNGRRTARAGASLTSLLQLASADARARATALLRESARYNAGAPRTINLPSLPLELLHARNASRFQVSLAAQRETVNGCDAARLELVERSTPTIIQREGGGDMPSRVTAWVEPGSGRLCRADVRTGSPGGRDAVDAVVSVDFTHHAELNLLVPSRMREQFVFPPRGRGEGEAVYTNYRRFTTSARIVPQP